MATPTQSRTGDAVAVIDDHDAVHAAVELWCGQSQPPITFAGTFFSAQSFLAAYPFGPDSIVGAVVFDVELQCRRIDFGSLDRMIDRRHRIIVYSDVATDEIILGCLERGASTFLLKSEGKSHLIKAIHAARSGTTYVGPRMAAAMLTESATGRPNLARREKEVLLAWIQTGNKDAVAAQLSIAPTTVSTHLQRVRAKYAAAGRPATTKAALVARAIQDGIVHIDDL